MSRIKGEESYQFLFDSFSLYFPDQAARAVKWNLCDIAMIAVQLDDGSTVTYDHLTGGMGYVGNDSSDAVRMPTQEEWRKEFAYRLYRQMLYNNIMQEELSDITGISQGTLSNYLNGRTGPSTYNLLLICDALDCEPADLIKPRHYIIKD